MKRIIELPKFVYAPIENGQTIGVIRYTMNDETVAVVPLTASADIPKIPPQKNIFEKIWNAIIGLFQ